MTDENLGSRARDHLANERTFLAWVRTALGGIALGIALERFGQDGSGSSVTALGLVMIAASMIALCAATLRYYRVARELDQGRFVVDRSSPIAIVVGALVITVVAVIVVF